MIYNQHACAKGHVKPIIFQQNVCSREKTTLELMHGRENNERITICLCFILFRISSLFLKLNLHEFVVLHHFYRDKSKRAGIMFDVNTEIHYLIAFNDLRRLRNNMV